eukprot:SAG22_NODE_2123_length_2975_cov_22.253477_5_plen_55_part_00
MLCHCAHNAIPLLAADGAKKTAKRGYEESQRAKTLQGGKTPAAGDDNYYKAEGE